MPQVPVYSTPQAQPQELPGVQFQTPFHLMQQSEIAAGQQVRTGEAIQRAGGALGQAAMQQQADINEATVKAAVSQVMDAHNVILRDKDAGYMNLQGADAVKNYDATLQALDQATRKAGEGLTNDAQRKMWAETSQRLNLQAVNEVRIHAGQQTKVYNMQQSDALTNASINSMVASSPTWDIDGSPFKMYAATAREQAAESARLRFGQNADPAIIDQQVKQVMTAAAGQVIGDLVTRGMPDKAKAYLDSLNPNDIDARQMDKLRSMVHENSTLQQAQQQSDAIYAGADGDMGRALDDARKIADPDVRQKTLALVKERFSEVEAAKNNTTRTANNAGLLMLTPGGGGLSKLMKSPVWQDMSAEARHTAVEWAKAAAQGDGTAKLDQIAIYQRILNEGGKDLVTFGKTNIVETAKKYGLTDKSLILDLVHKSTAIDSKDAITVNKMKAYKDAQDIYGPMLTNAGIVKPLAGMSQTQKEGQAKAVADFGNMMQTKIDDWIEHNGGKRPDPATIRQMVKDSLTPMFVRDSGAMPWSDDKSKPAYQVTPEEKPKAYIPAKDMATQYPAEYRAIYNKLQTQLKRAPKASEIENEFTRINAAKGRQ